MNVAAALAFAVLAAHASPDAASSSNASSSSSNASSNASSKASSSDAADARAEGRRPVSENGRVGVALLGGGAALATSTAAGITLMQAVTHPDDDRNPPQNPELTQVSGFVTVSLASLSAALMIIGGALVLEDVLAPPSAPTDVSSSSSSSGPSAPSGPSGPTAPPPPSSPPT